MDSLIVSAATGLQKSTSGSTAAVKTAPSAAFFADWSEELGDSPILYAYRSEPCTSGTVIRAVTSSVT